MILAIRTDKPEAEIYLYSAQGKELAKLKWHAHRELSKDIHKKIDEVFKRQSIDYADLKGLVLYEGPGSFTGLRIGASVANAVANELDIPIAGVHGEQWIELGISALRKGPKQRLVIPEYGAEPKTTKPKK